MADPLSAEERGRDPSAVSQKASAPALRTAPPASRHASLASQSIRKYVTTKASPPATMKSAMQAWVFDLSRVRAMGFKPCASAAALQNREPGQQGNRELIRILVFCSPGALCVQSP